MHLFTFEPGNGLSYRILFGRLPSPVPHLFSHYTIFGVAVGGSDPGPWYAFNTDLVDYGTFARHLMSDGARTMLDSETLDTAWAVWRVLTGAFMANEPTAATLGWRADWRDQIPLAARG